MLLAVVQIQIDLHISFKPSPDLASIRGNVLYVKWSLGRFRFIVYRVDKSNRCVKASGESHDWVPACIPANTWASVLLFRLGEADSVHRLCLQQFHRTCTSAPLPLAQGTTSKDSHLNRYARPESTTDDVLSSLSRLLIQQLLHYGKDGGARTVAVFHVYLVTCTEVVAG